jgi:hypothetical protein
MTLPDGFLFSQSNLQDYVDCQRRFQLRHLLHLDWPAVEAEPYLENERRIEQGDKFHRLVRQYLVGITEAEISESIAQDESMILWWDNFIQEIHSGNLAWITEPGNQRYAEITLSVPINRYRLIAKYDLLVIHPDEKITIIDWKSSAKHPKRQWLADRLQSHVYPFILVSAMSGFLGAPSISPDHIELIYWFPAQPEQPELFSYSQQVHLQDTEFLTNLITTIDQKNEPVFPLTPDVRRCWFCTYRSLCERGARAGDVQQMEQGDEPARAEEVTIDFDQIGEIEL